MAASSCFSSFTLRPSPKSTLHSPKALRNLQIPLLSQPRTLNLKSKPSFVAKSTTDDDEWGVERVNVNIGDGSAVAVADAEKPTVDELGEMKKKLKAFLYGTDRGLKASSETRAEIVELITQLEAKNPTPNPTEALVLLNGKWILAQTGLEPCSSGILWSHSLVGGNACIAEVIVGNFCRSASICGCIEDEVGADVVAVDRSMNFRFSMLAESMGEEPSLFVFAEGSIRSCALVYGMEFG